ncbi:MULTISPECIES: helix-turn-helix transcriptional regulator [Streptomycetaceae]|uniref:Putative DNA-binding protein n=1 Tax=Streptantibioticus cattleyicolor (strain ATCC 35852 / DSM 46488 / JCM 4925 / NBRC 14057 / NRRL 8057) TaxID=1003195 RepID=F8JVD2_STREN|nr:MULTISPECIES: helix-turn-helix transcriptional regulator [Streptomycetaceae]AEW94413.1 putative DNA-binding protein [Streptantibioticus cattleyicolor NRRL 8057 = DSM 46488]MYS59061.1 helix-turn-helix domain-containing protein [Streptomyces sp. SID5468]CCB74771.1 putative DNA-binding protein [Streptantibioticus cattleyicolor NRRL 8057 = DSM 46488]
MDRKEGSSELGEFLRTRRARLQPEDVGLVSYGNRRRVPGLRREELAQLAGVSVAYYTRLEQGQSGNASDDVLDAIARALRLGEDEVAHLRNLARPRRAKRRKAAPVEYARPGARQLIAAMPEVPAVVLDVRFDVLAWNPLGHALVAGHLDPAAPDDPARRPNLQRLLFLDPRTRELYPQWEDEARRAVSSLRLFSGSSPDDERLAELVGELSMKSGEFAALWSRHPVHNCTFGRKWFRHPEVGELELDFEMTLLPESGHRLLMYSAEPDSPSKAALGLLASTARRSPTRPPADTPAQTPHRS